MAATLNATYCKSCPKIRILQWKQNHEWHRKDVYIGELHQGTQTELSCIASDTQVYMIHANAGKVRSCDKCRWRLSGLFHMPTLWWEDYTKSSNGFFGCETTRDAGSEGFNTWVLLDTKLLGKNMEYYWLRFNIFTRYSYATNQTGVIIFDTKEFSPFAMEIGGKFVKPICLNDPFWVYSHILERVARASENAVWNIRDQVRAIEKKPLHRITEKADYRRLHHDIVRHAIHVTEALDSTVNTVEHIMKCHENHFGPKRTAAALNADEVTSEIWEDVHARLAFFQCYLSNLRHRSTANEKRIQNEIAMSFNMGAQSNADITVEISRAAKEDSGTMRTLSLVTLTFLPPTFICAVFSMSFFNYADSGWRVSGKIWIYWAFAIPTTLLTVLVWYGWTKIFPVERKAHDKEIGHRQVYELSGLI